MPFLTLAALAYALIAGFAIMMTLREQRQTGGRPLAAMIAGLLACVVWPFTALVVVVAIRRHSASA